MSTSKEEKPVMTEKRTIQRKFLVKDKAGRHPAIIDDFIPTVALRLTGGPGRGTATRGVGSAWLMGSRRLYGSLNTQIVEIAWAASTPNVYFGLVHSRIGTIDIEYLESKGKSEKLGNWRDPIETVGPGTLKIYAFGPGSSISQGKGSAVRYQGIGSGGAFALYGKVLGFQV